MTEDAGTAARRRQTADWVSDRENRVLIELGTRVRLALLNENHRMFSAEWRAGHVSAQAWAAAARARRAER